MKPILILLSVVVTCSCLYAQPFTPETDRYPFTNLLYPVAEAGDIDGDGDVDLLVAGRTGTKEYALFSYFNQGQGRFEDGASKVGNGVETFDTLDMEGDGDLDLVVVHREDRGYAEAWIYRNDGLGHYELVPGDPIANSTGVNTVKTGDFDLDGDTDILVLGVRKGDVTFCTVYWNGGKGEFTESAAHGIAAIQRAKVAVGDVNGDGYPDVVVSGRDHFEKFYRSAVYLNDGEQTFTPLEQKYFAYTTSADFVLGDVDGDRDLDVVILGADRESSDVGVYRNDGHGAFTQYASSGLPKFINAHARLLDLDQDGDLDLIAAGKGSTFSSHTAYYENDGTGFFTRSRTVELIDLWYAATAVADFDRSGTPDVLLAGNKVGDVPLTRIYFNDGADLRRGYRGSLPAIDYARVDAADINGDGLIDLVTHGGDVGWDTYLDLHLNVGGGEFERMEWPDDLASTVRGLKLVDIDGDGDVDLFTNCGYCGSASVPSCFYRNDGSGKFTSARLMPEVEFRIRQFVFGDVTGNGLPDLIVTGGSDFSRTYFTKVLYNLGDGTFISGDPDSSLPTGGGALALGDLNGDGAPDLVVGSDYRAERPSTQVYFNDGNGVFAVEGKELQPSASTHISVADITGDQHRDILIVTDVGHFTSTTHLYVNDGSGNMVLDNLRELPRLRNGTYAFGDSDLDGDLDMLVTGHLDTTSTGVFRMSRHYLNDGTGNFTVNPLIRMPAVFSGYVNFWDIDDDTDLDIYLAGKNFSDSMDYVGALYYNQANPVVSSSVQPVAMAGGTLGLAPNPNALEFVTLYSFGFRGDNLDVSVFSITGRLVLQRSVTAGDSAAGIRVPLTGLRPGVYIVQLSDHTRTRSGTLVVE